MAKSKPKGRGAGRKAAPGATTRRSARPAARGKPAPRAKPSPSPPIATSSADTSAAVDCFLAGLAHPHKAAIEMLRIVIRAADGSIEEGIEGAAPAFRTREYFAIADLQVADGLGLVLQLGAKARADPMLEIPDPDRLLEWLARDRAVVRFTGAEHVRARESALQALIREWIKYV
jgi:hypothetical protein